MCAVASRIAAKGYTVTPRYNTVGQRYLLGPPYSRGALWGIHPYPKATSPQNVPRLELEVEVELQFVIL